MIPVATLDDKEKKPDEEVYHNGTCAVCMQEITDHKYWRCPNSQCGRWEGSGRACYKCYKKLEDECYKKPGSKRECPVCRGDIEKNLITDPALLPSVYEYDCVGRHSLLEPTLRSLAKTHLDEVFAFAKHNADAMYLLTKTALTRWYDFPLPILQRLYSQLESAILCQSNKYSFFMMAWPVIKDAIKARVPWLVDSAQWIVEWRKQHKCPRGVVFGASGSHYRIHDLEAELLSLCRTEPEFMALYELATGRTHFDFDCFSDAIAEYLSAENKGEEWVMHRILAIIPKGDKDVDEKMGRVLLRLFRKFPYDGMYQWAREHGWSITDVIGFDVLKGIEYSLVPVFFACQKRGLYGHTKDHSVYVLEVESNATRTFRAWAPDGSNKILYVDLRSDSAIRDWSKVGNIKEVDAKGRDLCVEYRADGVDICFGSEPVVFAENSTALRITGFGSFSAKRVASEKRKFHLIE